MSNSTEFRDPIELLADEFLRKKRRGEQPTVEEFVARYPEYGKELSGLLRLVAELEVSEADQGFIPGVKAPSSGSDPDTLPRHLGDYRLLREIGRGGMGVVFEAEQLRLGRRVALKVLPTRLLLDGQMRMRFEREAKAAGKLHHTNIVPVFGVGEAQGTPYYVMQYISGRGLDEVLDELKRLRRGAQEIGTRLTGSVSLQAVPAAEPARSLLGGPGPPTRTETAAGKDDMGPSVTTVEETPEPSRKRPGSSTSPSSSSSPSSWVTDSLRGAGAGGHRSRDREYWREVARIGEQVAEALAYAHAKGVIHRDIKPSNLLLDTRGSVWITDFGLAKVEGLEDLTQSGDLLGTLRYMPPEAFSGKGDELGDVYALGVTLYELVALRPAFDETDRGRLIRRVTQESPPRLRKRNEQVPRDLETIIHKAIERDPVERYASATEMAEDLRRFIADEPIRARRLSAVERLHRWCRREPVIAGLSTALLVAMAAGTITSSLLARRAGDEARRATTALESESEARKTLEATNASLAETRDDLRRTLYNARMNLVRQSWNDGHHDAFAATLASARPGPGEPDLRGFEWYYLARRLRGDARTLPLADGWPSAPQGDLAIALAPDGGAAAWFGGDDGDRSQLGVWDTATGRKRFGHELPDIFFRTRMAFSGDGSRVALSWASRAAWHLRVFDLSTGREEFARDDPPSEPPAPGSSRIVALSGDGRRLAVAIRSSRAPSETGPGARWKVWEVPEGKLVMDVSARPGGPFGLTPDGETLVEVGPGEGGPASSVLRLWDVSEGIDRAAIDLGDGLRTSLAIRPDGLRAVVSGLSRDGQHGAETIVDLARSETLGTAFVVGVMALGSRFSPDGRYLALSLPNSPLVRVVDAGSGAPIREFRHPRNVREAAFGSGGRTLVTLDQDNVVREWELTGIDPERMGPRFEASSVRWGALSPDTNRVALIEGKPPGDGPGHRLTVFDAGTREPLWRAMPIVDPNLRAPEFSPDAKRLGLWVRMGTPLPEPIRESAGLPRPEGLGNVGIRVGVREGGWRIGDVLEGGVAARDGRSRPGDALLAIRLGDGPPIDLADRTLPEIRRFLAQPPGTPVGLVVRPQGAEGPATYDLISGPSTSEILYLYHESFFLVWDAESGREVAALRPGPGRFEGTNLGPLPGAAFRPVGGEIALPVVEVTDEARHDGDGFRHLVQLHDETGRAIRDLSYPPGLRDLEPLTVAFSPDGTYLAVAANVRRPGHDPVARGAVIVAWEVETGRIVLDERPSIGADEPSSGGPGACLSMAFGPNGETLAAGFGDRYDMPGTVLIWDLRDGSLRRRLGGLPRPVQGVGFDREGRRVLTVTPAVFQRGRATMELKLWDMASGTELLSLPTEPFFSPPVFSGDGRRLVAVSRLTNRLRNDEALLVTWEGEEPEEGPGRPEGDPGGSPGPEDQVRIGRGTGP